MSLLSVLAVFPYVATIQSEVLKAVPLPIGVILVVQLVQSAILFSLAIFIGLLLARKTNFRMPILESLASRGDYKQAVKNISYSPIVLGILVAVAIYATDYLFTMHGAKLSTSQNLAPIWQKLLAAFYGGITEEILMRLGLMTMFTWTLAKLMRQRSPSLFVVIISIIVSAIIFGLGHLPITASLTAITPLIVLRAIVLNGIGGVVFGWLYYRRGLESAMVAHFTADIFLLTLLPLFVG